MSAAWDFAPDLLALQERPPASMPRVVGGVVVAACALMLAWAAWAKLDIVAVAEGRLVPQSLVKLVQPAEAGVVREILVKEGDTVAQGQLLFRMDPRLSQADSSAFERDVWLKTLSLRRAEAELAEPSSLSLGMLMGDGTLLGDNPGSQARARPDWLPMLASQVLAQYQARRRAHLDAIAQEQNTLEKAQAEDAAARQVLEKLRATLPAYRQSALAYDKLHKEGFVGELAAVEKQREAMEREQDMKAQAATLESLQAAIAQARSRLTALQSSYRADLENERMELQTQLARSKQDLQKSNVRDEFLEIRAPQAGVVKDLGVTTAGAVVQAGTLLMNLVPQGDLLQAEVLLKNEDAGFVVPGQVARIKVAAYPFQKYGLIDAQVLQISADATDPKPGSTQMPLPAQATYKALIAPQAAQLSNYGQRLQAGMMVSAEIQQGQRTVLEYLLSPVQKVRQEAGRER
ncbi:HlyD family type I secretion periplasmic adaptor subunit [Ideonella azotifigens]|uniref:HlyD family type I secretion periplasmic adaptor subunit n=1 Tax=Ideonella azotifigens TaxID=513160 RepID=UPI001E28BDC2|nr:HlyD family type I secretion periplasmic adaptor subunit [Ideonella azotifigens]MCD2340933.1 HlyD family type I secretion periplasmic adaptor subunit [Ideonella azotifigens]